MNWKKAILLVPFAGLLLTSCGTNTYSPADYVAGSIQYKEGFRILQLSDLHLGAKDNLKKHYDFIDLTIKDANADFIVLTGDNFTFATKESAKEFINFIDSYDIPWTLVFGNHDEQCYFSIDWITKYLNDFGSNCYFKDNTNDDVFGYSNFVVNLTDGGEVKEQLIFMDSNRYDFGNGFGYDFIKPNQVQWYEDMVNYTKTENGGTVVPSLMFFHIPLPEFADAYVAATNGDPDATFIGDYHELREDVCASDTNSNLFAKMQELGSTKGLFVGHDHVNSFTIKYKGIYLGYAVTSTNRVYADDDLMGGQVIVFNKDTGDLTVERYLHTYSELEG